MHKAGGVDTMQRNNSPFRGVVVQADILSLPTFQTAYQRGAEEIAALRQLAAVDQRPIVDIGAATSRISLRGCPLSPSWRPKIGHRRMS
jgi:hypothetical protein